MEKYYRFAGLDFAISTRDEWMYDDEQMLAPYRVSSVTNPHRFYFSMVDQLSAPSGDCLAVMDNFSVYRDGDTDLRYIGAPNGDWSAAYMRTCHCGREHIVELKNNAYFTGVRPKHVLNAIELEHRIIEISGFVFHASFVDIGGKGVLFTAPSGTGKSTQADLWNQLRGARIINGDRCVVRSTDTGTIACGIPFMGSSQYYLNESLPLAGIVYLAQAPQTSIRRLRGLEAFRRIWEGVSVNTWEKADMSVVMDTVSQVVQNVPAWYMACTPDESAVVALEQQLGK